MVLLCHLSDLCAGGSGSHVDNLETQQLHTEPYPADTPPSQPRQDSFMLATCDPHTPSATELDLPKKPPKQVGQNSPNIQLVSH